MTDAPTPRKRRATGEPKPYQRADGMWRVALELPSPDGSRRRKYFVAKTEGALKLKLKEAKRVLLKNGDLSTASVTPCDRVRRYQALSRHPRLSVRRD